MILALNVIQTCAATRVVCVCVCCVGVMHAHQGMGGGGKCALYQIR
jgi:hypothetical protein